MKIAIHYKQGGFTERWIQYCKENNIEYKSVNCYDTDIIKQLGDCEALLWHHHHADYKDKLFAKQLLFSLQQAGKKVFPDFNTGWHFDDKVGQKYLLESIHAPLVPSYVFYTKEEAIKWAKETSFPKVFKLRGGAGAENVRLVKNEREAKKLISKAFGKGFRQYNAINNLKERWRKYQLGKSTFIDILKGITRLVCPTTFSRLYSPEKGYVYFQDFIPDNKTDYRIKIVNGKCWGFQRKVRTDDFRASGSDVLIFDNSLIPIEMIRISFDVYQKLFFKSIAFDFVVKESQPLIVEISYCFGFEEQQLSNGYWTKDLMWHEGAFNPFGWMIESIKDSSEFEISNK